MSDLLARRVGRDRNYRYIESNGVTGSQTCRACTDGTAIYYPVGNTSSATWRSTPLAGPGPFRASSAFSGGCTNPVTFGGYLYWGATAGASLVRMAVSPWPSAPQTTFGPFLDISLALLEIDCDGVNFYVANFVASAGQGLIQSLPVGGGAWTHVVASTATTGNECLSLKAAGGTVFWCASTGYWAGSTRLLTGSFGHVATNRTDVFASTVSTTTPGIIYHSLASTPLVAPTVFFTEAAGVGIQDVCCDLENVYWASVQGGATPVYTLKRMPIAGGTPTVLNQRSYPNVIDYLSLIGSGIFVSSGPSNQLFIYPTV